MFFYMVVGNVFCGYCDHNLFISAEIKYNFNLCVSAASVLISMIYVDKNLIKTYILVELVYAVVFLCCLFWLI